MSTELIDTFQAVFHHDHILEEAKKLGAVKRLRNIHPAHFLASIVGSAMGDEQRSIATARRHYGVIAGSTPEESSFYNRFTGPMTALAREIMVRGFASCNRHQRRALAAVLDGTGLIDVQAIDGTQITLPKTASKQLPSTNDDHGGIKLTTTLSVLFQTVDKVTCTNARTHDRKALKLDRWLHGRLLLMDRGYYDHSLFKTVEQRGGSFIVPLKATAKPTITGITSGLGQRHVGTQISDDLPYRGTVDMDVSLQLSAGRQYHCRIVRVPIITATSSGVTEHKHVWLTTNLSRQDFTPEHIATLYRMRWEVELAFKTMKTVGRIDHLKSANINVIKTFIYATLIGTILTQITCAYMRERWGVEPSFYRVAAIILTHLTAILMAKSPPLQRHAIAALTDALFREGVNPNPGRPYKHNVYPVQILESGTN